jgi:hypothetical protein
LECSGFLYGKSYDESFDTWDAYASWRIGVAARPESETNNVFAAMCKNQGCDPTAYAVRSQYADMVYNVTLKGRDLLP